MSKIKIVDPKKPHDYLVISERDFDPAVHRVWTEPAEVGTSDQPRTDASPKAVDLPDPDSDDRAAGSKRGNDISAYDYTRNGRRGGRAR